MTVMRFGLFVLLLVASGSGAVRGQDAPRLDVRFVEHLVIGDDERAGAEYLFAGPRDVAVDDEGYLYVADSRSADVRVFTKDGTYVRTLGRRGQGPGEFTEVSAMIVDEHGDLVVADRFNQRVTRFARAEDGFTHETYPIAVDGPAWLYDLLSLGEGRFGLVYKPGYAEASSRAAGSRDLLHVYEGTFARETASAVPYTDFYDADDPFHRALTDLPAARFSVDDAGRVLVVPKFYEGTIYRYERSSSGWTVDRIDGGYAPGYPAYAPYDRDDYSREDRPFQSLVITNRRRGRFAAAQQKVSRGAFVLADGTVVHFSTMGQGDERVHGVEVFDSDGRLVGYGPIEGYTSTKRTPLHFRVFAVDEAGRFYVTDDRGGFPVVRVVSLEYAAR